MKKTEVFLYWLDLQQHKWNERNRRIAAINRLMGTDEPVLDFPIEVLADKGLIYDINGRQYFEIDDSQELMDKAVRIMDDAVKRGKV